MANKLTILLSGRSHSGRATCANFILCEYLNRKIGAKRFTLEKTGKEYRVFDSFNNIIIPTAFPNSTAEQIYKTYSVKMYSFNNPLWDFCINCLGLEHTGCYGFEGDENANTHILWDDLFQEIRDRHGRVQAGDKIKAAKGLMNNHEIINCFKNDILRRIDPNCLSRWLLNTVEADGHDLAIIFDAEYPPDITLFAERGAKTIRLLKAGKKDPPCFLENLSLGEFAYVLDNGDMTAEQAFDKIRPKIHSWFQDRRLFND